MERDMKWKFYNIPGDSLTEIYGLLSCFLNIYLKNFTKSSKFTDTDIVRKHRNKFSLRFQSEMSQMFLSNLKSHFLKLQTLSSRGKHYRSQWLNSLLFTSFSTKIHTFSLWLLILLYRLWKSIWHLQNFSVQDSLTTQSCVRQKLNIEFILLN